MQIDPVAAKSARPVAPRETARSHAADHPAKKSHPTHDQRVKEATSSHATRPSVAEKRADRRAHTHAAPPSGRTRPQSGSKILDVMA